MTCTLTHTKHVSVEILLFFLMALDPSLGLIFLDGGGRVDTPQNTNLLPTHHCVMPSSQRTTTTTTLVGWIFLNIASMVWLVPPLPVTSWTTSPILIFRRTSSTTVDTQRYVSTPFEADLYDNDDDDDNDPLSSLAVSSDTRLVLGLNKYSHDTALCAADARTGQILWAQAKERQTRRKHDAGNVATLTEACLCDLHLALDNIHAVVVNNHHYRVGPLEANRRHMEWECGLAMNGGAEDGYDEDENLLLTVASTTTTTELSHHLAHAYSAAAQAPFANGLIVVMDGMGETYRTMRQAVQEQQQQQQTEKNDLSSSSSPPPSSSYISDLSFGADTFQCVPSNIEELAQRSRFDWREAESVYRFAKDTIDGSSGQMDLRPVFKRFTQEHSPPVLYNHGFENMDSLGALYSRASSHIFGDWNACGKVMGLAPWMGHQWQRANGDDPSTVIEARTPEYPIVQGNLYTDNGLLINRTLMEGQPHITRNDPELFTAQGEQTKRYDFDDSNASSTEDPRIPAQVALDAIGLAHRIQIDLETVAMDFVRHWKQQTGETNLCLAGGVALNSVLNGRLARELGFEQTFIPPYPGDDGIAVGCCAFGLFGNKALEKSKVLEQRDTRPPLWEKPLSPYLGPDPSERAIREAIADAEPWLEIDIIRDDRQRLQLMVDEIAAGGVIAWYQSRSEMGPRALGHRSILADPRKKGLVRFINEHVKSRESFRPFAPSCLAEEATNWFDLGPNVPEDGSVSPFMSMTAIVHSDKRGIIPAVTHVDGSSRMQTVTAKDEPLYHQLISMFFEKTKVPMVLNTSFNTVPSEPIVETPAEAIRSFLYSMGSLEMLVMGDYVIRRKLADLKRLLGEATKDGQVKAEPACPQRAGRAYIESSVSLEEGPTDEATSQPTLRVRMPDRPLHVDGKNEWFTLLDELEGQLLSVSDGTTTLNEIVAEFTTMEEGEELDDAKVEDAQTILQNVVHRFVRLYEHTLVYW